MQPINRVCFEIQKEKEAENPTFDAVVYRVLDWLKRRSFVTDPMAVLDCDQTMAQTSAGDGALVESLMLEEEGKRGWGIRYGHPDSDKPELRWVGEVTLLDEGGAGFSTRTRSACFTRVIPWHPTNSIARIQR